MEGIKVVTVENIKQFKKMLSVGDACTVKRKHGKNKNKVKIYEGEINAVYDNFFTVEVKVRTHTIIASYKYIDVLLVEDPPIKVHKIRRIS